MIIFYRGKIIHLSTGHIVSKIQKNIKAIVKNAGDFTAGDSYKGYVAHSPENDFGVIQPTAALSSMPYTPKESMEALRYFYYESWR